MEQQEVFMITLQQIIPDVIKVDITGKISTGELKTMTPEIDKIIARERKVRLILDVSKFTGWEDMPAIEEHFSFIKNHHHYIERAAIITGHTWQHWMISIIKVFIHPDVRVFEQNQVDEAYQYIEKD
jgi:SpoIIAA-like